MKTRAAVVSGEDVDLGWVVDSTEGYAVAIIIVVGVEEGVE